MEEKKRKYTLILAKKRKIKSHYVCFPNNLRIFAVEQQQSTVQQFK